MTKAMMVVDGQLVVFDPEDECFTHRDHDGTIRHFNATAMNKYVDAHPDSDLFETIDYPPDLEWAKWCVMNRGIEAEHLARITEQKRTRPILGVVMPAGTTLIVDGHHRLVQWALDDYTGKMIRFHPGTWDRFLIRLPKELSEALAAVTI